jgi:hypothetical protein
VRGIGGGDEGRIRMDAPVSGRDLSQGMHPARTRNFTCTVPQSP